jgi:hypothetical protein
MMAQVYGTATSPAAADRALFARAGYDEDDDTPTIPRNAAFGGDRWGTGHNTTTFGDDPRATGNSAAASQRGRGPASSSPARREEEGEVLLNPSFQSVAQVIVPVSTGVRDWSDYEELLALMPEIRRLARVWNTPTSGLTDDAFAALMLASLHTEARLRRLDLVQEPLQVVGALVDLAGDVLLQTSSRDSSTGIANLRPSVVREIIEDQIPRSEFGLPDAFFEDFGLLSNLSAFRDMISRGGNISNGEIYLFLQSDVNSLELMAANIQRGIQRLPRVNNPDDPESANWDSPTTIYNLAAWMNRGVQTPEGYNQVDEEIYANRVLMAFSQIASDPSAFRLSATDLEAWYDYEYYNDDELNRLYFDVFSMLPPRPIRA